MIRLLATAILVPVLSFGQTATPASPTVFFDQDSPFAPDFTAALMAKNVPVAVTTDPDHARYTVSFSTVKNNGSIFQGITSAINNGNYDPGGWDRVTMQVVDNQTKIVTFSYTCKKYKDNSGDPMKSTAECLAKHWKSKLQK